MHRIPSLLARYINAPVQKYSSTDFNVGSIGTTRPDTMHRPVGKRSSEQLPIVTVLG